MLSERLLIALMLFALAVLVLIGGVCAADISGIDKPVDVEGTTIQDLSEKGVRVIVDDRGTVEYHAAGAVTKLNLILDGAEFSPVVSKTDSDGATFTSGEKEFFVLDNPDVIEKYVFSDGNLEESVTIKERKDIAYRIEVPVGAYLIRLPDGSYKIHNPSVDENIDGYIKIHRAWGVDAKSERVEFDYIQTAPGVLQLVYPKGDLTTSGKEIQYPLYVDPLLELTSDMALLAHFNNGEDRNFSLFKFVDSSHHVAQLNGATSNTALNLSSVSPAKYGNASFRSTGTAADVVISPKDAAYNISNQYFGFSLYANFTATIGNNKSLIYGGDSVSGGYSWILYLNNNTAITFASTGDLSSSNTCRMGAVSTNRWHQFTVIKNSTSWMGIYQNQTLLCSFTPPGRINLPDSGNAAIQIPYGPSTVAYSLAPMTGYIDEAVMYIGGQGREIDDFPDAEIPMYTSSAFSSGGYADDNNTVMLLHFNDVNNGLNFTDKTGKTWARGGTGNVISTNASVFDGSSLFSSAASGSYLYTSTAVSDVSFGSDDFTIDFWIRPNGTANGGIFTTKTTSSIGYYLWWQASTGKVFLSGNTSGSTSANLINTNAIQNNTWSHIAITRYGPYLETYVNGEKNTSATIDISREFNAEAASVDIGHLTVGVSTGTFGGWIDEFRVSRERRWYGNFTVPTTPYEITDASFTHDNPEDFVQTFPIVINFTDTTPDSNWTNNNWYWTFGDGNYSTLEDVSQAYYSNGTFTIELRTWNNNMTDTYSDSITIGVPHVDFYATPRAGTAAMLVQFTDETTNLTPIAAWNWSFGDGSFSDQQNPQHVYAEFGSFDVNLTVTCADGSDSELKTDYIVTSTEQDSPLQSYPKFVSFHIKEGWGAPLSDVNISVTPVSTSTGDWDWLVTLAGIPLDEVAIDSEVLYQTTDSMGTATFYVIPTAKYNVTFTKTGYTIAPMVLVPQDDDYIIWAGAEPSFFETGYDELEMVNISAVVVDINSTHAFLNISYNDTLAHTTGGFINVTKKNATAAGAPVALASFPAVSSSFTNSTIISHTTQTSVLATANISHSDFGQVERSLAFELKGAAIQMLGLGSDILLLLAMGIMIITTMGGGVLVGRPAAFVTCFEGWIFYGFRWLDPLVSRGFATDALVILALSIATVLAVLANFEVRKKKEKY